VIRSLSNPLDADVYTEHQAETTVAKYAPSGNYIASGDKGGKIRIWDTLSKEHILKIELPVLGGKVADIAWTDDSKRILAVGDGREAFGTAFMWDAGSTVGTIDGHSKTLQSCDLKPGRPYRAVTGGLDFQVNFYPGVPFKFKHSIKDHERFVNCVRYSPDGAKFVSVGSDKKGFLYDGKEGTKVGELAADAHKAGIYSASFDPSSAKVATASADKTVKVFDASSGAVEKSFSTSDNPQTDDQQLGVAWVGDTILSVSLGSSIAHFDAAAAGGPPKTVWHGHNKFITAITASAEFLYTASYTGQIIRWNQATGETTLFKGTGHTNQIKRVLLAGSNLLSTAMDDSVRVTPTDSLEYSTSMSTAGLPSDLAATADGAVAVVATNKAIQLIKGGAIKATAEFGNNLEGKCVALSPDGTEAAVGVSDGRTVFKVFTYTISGDSITKKAELVKDGQKENTAAAYSGDGKYLALADKRNEIWLVERSSGNVAIKDWINHTAPPNRLVFSPNSSKLASSSMDSAVIVWNVIDPKPDQRVHIRRAHPLGATDVCWVDDKTIITAGYDCTSRKWTLKK
jgi:WD40 repeat protein